MTLSPADMLVATVGCIEARQPLLIQGPPGGGKTSIGFQAAPLAGIAPGDVILSHPVVEDPTDAKGIPWVVDGTADFLPFGALRRAMGATRPTLWILDDLGQASPAMQAAYMQLLLAREVNGHKLPDCVTFLAMTNRRTDRAGVSGILEPVKSRFLSILELETSVDDFSNWALSNGQRPEVIAFVRLRPELLSDFQASADMENSPSPRTWSHVSSVLNMGLPAKIETAMICGAIGDGAGMEFVGFLRMYQELPSIDAILIDPQTGDIPDSPATLYAITTGLATRVNDQTFGRIAEYATRILDANHGEFAALLLRDCLKRDDTITQTTDFVRLAAGPLGDLISGGN